MLSIIGEMETLLFSPRALAILLFALLFLFLRHRWGCANGSEDWKLQNFTIGLRNRWFPWALATIRSLSESRQWASEGYTKYSKSKTPFVVPTLDRGPVVVIPPNQFKQVYGYPTNIVDVHMTSHDTIQTKYTIGDPKVMIDSIHINVIRHQLTRNLGPITPRIAAELKRGFERCWGQKTEWQKFRIWDSCLTIIAGAANGAFFGPPLCRNVEFLGHLQDHASAVLMGGMLINHTPKLFRPIIGTLIGILCQFRFQKALGLCIHIVKGRLDNTARLMDGSIRNWTPPQDGLQWIIEECFNSGDPSELDPVRIARRLIYINDVSLHTTSYTMQNMILDLYGPDTSADTIRELREEAARVLEESGGSWTREAVQNLKLIDSAIREAMRITPFACIGLPRTVIHPDGITIEAADDKVHIPCGMVFAAPLEGVHHDEDIYPDSRRYKPFRFVGREASHHTSGPKKEAVGAADNRTDRSGSQNDRSSVTLDEDFLSFGIGKHACPGRFFAVNEMKLFVAHMLLNYDVECLSRRPKARTFGWIRLPYNDGQVRVRKRSAGFKEESEVMSNGRT